jgi:integrase|nr:site-specific integrase [Lamprocystis purpurea]
MPKARKRDQDGLFQRPDSPYWWAATPDGLGGSTRRSTGIRIDADPKGLKAAAMRAGWLVTPPPVPTAAGYTFDDLLLAYLDQVTPTKRAPERDRWSAKALFPAFSGKTLASIDGAEVRAYIAKRTAQGIAAGTLNKEIGLMSAALNWVRRELDWDVSNPWESRRQREPAGRARWLTPEEAAVLLAEAERRVQRWPWLLEFMRLGLYAGLRPGEILGLEWSRVDFDRDRIIFAPDDQKNAKFGSVPLNHESREALMSRARFRSTWCPGSSWVFARKDGSRIASVKVGFASCVKSAGLADIHPHDLRRTFGSWLVQAGVGIDRVSKLLRHGDVAITARVYAHLRPSDLSEAVAVLDRTGPTVSRSGFTFADSSLNRD